MPLTVEDIDHSILSRASDTSEERYTPYELFQTADGTQAQSAERIHSAYSGVATALSVHGVCRSFRFRCRLLLGLLGSQLFGPCVVQLQLELMQFLANVLIVVLALAAQIVHFSRRATVSARIGLVQLQKKKSFTVHVSCRSEALARPR